MPAQSFAKQAKKYETIQRIFSWLSIASLIGTYLPIFIFLNSPWKLFAGTITGIVCIFVFFLLSLRFQDKANEAKLNSLALVKYLIEKNKESQ